MGPMLSGLHLVREENDRILAAAAMLTTIAAIALALVGAFAGR